MPKNFTEKGGAPQEGLTCKMITIALDYDSKM